MNLTQLLSINGELQTPLTASESNTTPIPSGKLPKSGRGILARWDLGKREATTKGKLPYALICLEESRFATARFSRSSDESKAFSVNPTPLKSQGMEKKISWQVILRRLAFWLLLAVIALATIACGFGIQEIRFVREKHRLGQQLRFAEEKRKIAELACRQMHASMVVYAARESRANQNQNQTRPVAYAPPKPKAKKRS